MMIRTNRIDETCENVAHNTQNIKHELCLLHNPNAFIDAVLY